MTIYSVGGGPGGLYFAILAKLGDPRREVAVIERNPAGTTYGWGIGFWDDMLHGLYRSDPATARRVHGQATRWTGQQLVVRDGPPVHLGGYGYGIGRQKLLDILRDRAQEVGVEMQFGRTVGELDDLPDAELIVLANGGTSRLRESRATAFRSSETVGGNTFVWLGTARRFDAFTFAFEKTRAGWIWMHAYGYDGSRSTVVVECHPRTWQGLGLGSMSHTEGLELLTTIFASHLDGFPLEDRPDAVSPARWSRFTGLTNERWHHENVVLLGDAAHTTHFSIGSGTRLALEDAAALARAVTSRASTCGLTAALQDYQGRRQPVAEALQRAAWRSAAWFDEVDLHLAHDPVDVGYSIRMRRADRAPDLDPHVRRSLGYQLHLATQCRPLRTARRVVSAVKRRLAGRGRHLDAA